MKKSETVRSATNGQRNDVSATLTQCIPANLTFDDAQNIIGRKGPFMADIRALFAKYSTEPIQQAIVEWQTLYQDVFGIVLDFSGVKIPVRKQDLNWLVIVAQGVGPQAAFDQCKKLFPAWKYYDESLDVAVPTNDRDSKSGSYAIWMRDRAEADQEFADKSADDIKQLNVSCNTLLERLLLELWYFRKTGKHLDIDNVTLCPGSRYSVGRVPLVHWHDDKFHVHWYNPDCSGDNLRAREVAS